MISKGVIQRKLERDNTLLQHLVQTEIFKILNYLHQHRPEEPDVLKRNKILFDIARCVFSLLHEGLFQFEKLYFRTTSGDILPC